MSLPRKAQNKTFGRWHATSHAINRYKQRVPDPQLRSRTNSDIERILARALKDVDIESQHMSGSAYVCEVYFSPKGRTIGPFYLFVERSDRKPGKYIIASLYTEEMYRQQLGVA